MNSRLCATLLALVMLAALAGGVSAVSTEFYRYARMEDYRDASFRGLRLSDDGSWRLGDRWEEMLADELPFFTEMAGDGKRLLLAGGGGPGKLILFDKGKRRHRSIHSDDELLFSCVEVLGEGHWAVGAGPGGKVFAVNGEGELSELVDTEEDFVWDLLCAGDRLYIATGAAGKIYRHDLGSGETEVFATLPDENVFCLAMDGKGRLLAGSSGEGTLHRFDHEGRRELLADFEAEEVQKILPLGEALYVAVARSDTDCEDNCGAVYMLTPSGLLEKTLTLDSAFVGDLLAAPGGGIWVASGDPAELDLLTGLYQGEVLAAEDGVFFNDLHHDGEALWLLQSKPSRLIRIETGNREGTLHSEILDLTSRSVAGALRIEGELPSGCSFTAEARAGQGARPGEGWTDWRPCADEDGLFRMDLPPARYFQWRVTLKGKRSASPRVDRITVSFLPLNRSPLVGNLLVLRPTDGPYEDGMDLSGRPFTQILERGVRVQYQQKNGSPPADESATALWRGLRQIHWDWLDPDGDRLQARIEARREGEEAWQLLADAWPQSVYTWDGRGLPDGLYRLRITADDGLDNSGERARSITVFSEPVRLDGRPPRFELELRREKDRRLRLQGHVRDEGGGIVQTLERRDWDGRWLPLAAADGIMDRSLLELDLVLDPPREGEEPVLEIRAADEFGNWNYFRRELGSVR